MAEAIVALIDRRIGGRMIEFADRLEELGDTTGTLTVADLIVQLREHGEVLKQTYSQSEPDSE